MGDERIENARLLYDRAVFGGDADALDSADRVLDAVEADLALARGRIVHARYLNPREVEQRVADPTELTLFERAASLYESLGDVRGQAEAQFWIGIYHQVVRDDPAAAVPFLERSREMATRADDALVLSYALRHLAFVEQAAGRVDEARARLEESVHLRRSLGFDAGVAANLVALAYLTSDRDEALAYLNEARALAEASEAHGVLRWITDALRTWL